jgi:hypothetical protein
MLYKNKMRHKCTLSTRSRILELFIVTSSRLCSYLRVCVINGGIIRGAAAGCTKYYSGIICGRAMAQAVSRRPSTAEARVRSRVSPCGVCGGQSGTGTGFSPSCRFSPVNFIPLVLHYL